MASNFQAFANGIGHVAALGILLLVNFHAGVGFFPQRIGILSRRLQLARQAFVLSEQARKLLGGVVGFFRHWPKE